MIKKIARAGILMLAGLVLAFQDMSIASGGAHDLDDVCPYLVAGKAWENPFSEVKHVIAYVKSHPNITGIGLVHHELFPDPFPLTFLNDHPNIKKLILRGNTDNPAIFKLSSLRHITSFTNNLFYDGRPLSFDYMPGLVELSIFIHDFPSLCKMPELHTLRLKARYDPSSKTYSSQGIKEFNMLTLNMHETQIGDTTSWHILSNLDCLELDSRGWEKHYFAFIQQLKNLRSLEVNDGNKMNLAVLTDLPMLEDFRIWCNKAASKPAYLEPLTTLPRLRRLSVASDMCLSDISALSKCASLEDLDFSVSRVKSLESLRALPLRRLIMFGSDVTDLSPLAGITTLQLLDITNSRRLQGWEGLKNHPTLRRIKAWAGDFCFLSDFTGTGNSEENVTEQVSMPNPFHVLKTIPNLELVSACPFDKTQHMFDEFAKDRPDVLVGYYVDWETRVITKRASI